MRKVGWSFLAHSAVLRNRDGEDYRPKVRGRLGAGEIEAGSTAEVLSTHSTQAKALGAADAIAPHIPLGHTCRLKLYRCRVVTIERQTVWGVVPCNSDCIALKANSSNNEKTLWADADWIQHEMVIMMGSFAKMSFSPIARSSFCWNECSHPWWGHQAKSQPNPINFIGQTSVLLAQCEKHTFYKMQSKPLLLVLLFNWGSEIMFPTNGFNNICDFPAKMKMTYFAWTSLWNIGKWFCRKTMEMYHASKNDETHIFNKKIKIFDKLEVIKWHVQKWKWHDRTFWGSASNERPSYDTWWFSNT